MPVRRQLALAVTVLAIGLTGVVTSPGVTPVARADQNESAVQRIAAASITTGDRHTCLLTPAGDVRCWGYGALGRIGYGNTDNIGDNEIPASAGDVPLGAKATAITAGEMHTCALLSTGDVRCWGSNAYGQLGYGNDDMIGDNETPASAGDVPLGAKATAIAAGTTHTCAILTTGDVRCWGDGSYGMLGYGNIDSVGDDETPASVGDVPLGAKATSITAGAGHTCVILTTGNVRCWGFGNSGRLGYGSPDNIGDNETPASAGDVPLGATATAITAGNYHTCATLTTGNVRCWGNGSYGKLGYGNTNDIGDGETPANAGDVPLGATATAITAGALHTCATLTTGNLRCWGEAGYGRMGYGNTDDIGDDDTPASAGDVPLGAKALMVTASVYHTCAVISDGRLRCWGLNDVGQLGYGSVVSLGDTPETVPAVNGTVPTGVLARTGVATSTGIATSTSLSATPKRDRRTPYTYLLRGRVTGAFVPNTAICQGTVQVVIKRRSRTLRKARVALRPDCSYRSKLKFSQRKLRTNRKVVLKATARYSGAADLTASAKRIRVTAN